MGGNNRANPVPGNPDPSPQNRFQRQGTRLLANQPTCVRLYADQHLEFQLMDSQERSTLLRNAVDLLLKLREEEDQC